MVAKTVGWKVVEKETHWVGKMASLRDSKSVEQSDGTWVE